MHSAPEQLKLALILPLWTGQRQGDRLRLPWSAYDGSRIRLMQRKTGIRASIKVGVPLKQALDATKRQGPMILENSDGRPGHRTRFAAHGIRHVKRLALRA